MASKHLAILLALGAAVTASQNGGAPNIAADLPTSWTYSGCFLDFATARLFSGASFASDSSMTQESCVSFCSAKGYNYAGVEYGSQCYCDYSFRNPTSEPESSCSMPCSGNSTEACGAADRMNVFSNGLSTVAAPRPSPQWSLLGCYNDTIADRALSHQVPADDTGMTVEYCTSSCQAGGYSYAGVEYSSECYCDNLVLNGAISVPVAGCNMPCQGNSSEYCGGPLRLNMYHFGASSAPTSTPAAAPTSTPAEIPTPPVLSTASTPVFKTTSTPSTYATSSPPATTPTLTPPTPTSDTVTATSTPTPALTWTALGCYNDFIAARTLRYFMNAMIPGGYRNMTVEACRSVCSAANYTLAGLEYSQECWCDDVVRAPGICAADQSTCNAACRGDATEVCGAANRLSLWGLGDGAGVAPCPAQNMGEPSKGAAPVVSASAAVGLERVGRKGLEYLPRYWKVGS